jgi:hypothetical protein
VSNSILETTAASATAFFFFFCFSVIAIMIQNAQEHLVIHKVKEFIGQLKLTYFVLFTKLLSNLDFVRMIMQKVRELAAELTCADFAMWHLLPVPHYQVYGPNVDGRVVYCPSVVLLDVIR